MSKRLFKVGLLSGIFTSFLVGGFVFAQGTDLGFQAAQNIGGGAIGTADIRDVIVNVVNIALGFLGIIAVIIMIYGGWVWMTSGGNAERVDTAKRILRNAVIGLAIIIGSWTLTLFLFRAFSGATGGNLTCPVVGVVTSCAAGCGDSICLAGNVPGPCTPNGSCLPSGSGQFAVIAEYPTVTSGSNVCLNTIIFAVFNEVVDNNTVSGNFLVQQCGDASCSLPALLPAIDGTASSLNSLRNDSQTVEFIPGALLNVGADYRVTLISDTTIPGTIAALTSGNQLPLGRYSWTFTSGSTQDLVAPLVLTSSLVPPDGDTNVCLETFIAAEFNEVMRPSTLDGTAIEITSSGNVPTYLVGPAYLPTSAYLSSPHHAIIAQRPSVPHDPITQYDVQIQPTVQDACQNFLAAPYGSGPTPGSDPWSFTTGSTLRCLPVITGITTSPGADGFYDNGETVSISGRYLSPLTETIFGNNTDVVSSPSCLAPIPNQINASNICLSGLSNPIQIVTQLPSGGQVAQGAQDGTVIVTTPSGVATSPAPFNVDAPFIGSINSGRTTNGYPAAGLTNFISIFGNQFVTPQVWFTEVNNPGNRVQADFPCGPGSFSNSQIIAAFPATHPGPSNDDEYHVQIEINDSGTIRHSNVGRVVLDNAGSSPGLCAIDPITGPVGAGINFIDGSQLGLLIGPEVHFGVPGGSIEAVGNPPAINPGGGVGGLDRITGNLVPAVQSQNGIGVFVTDGTLTSNSVQFDVTGTSAIGPIIYDFVASIDTSGNPVRSGGIGQYITISGVNFGATQGNSQIRFYTIAEDVSGSTVGSGYFLTFPLQCQGNLWTNTQIITKVPLGLPVNQYFLAVDTPINGIGTTENLINTQFDQDGSAPGPGICAINPANGVAGSVVDIYGDHFGGSTGQVEFYNNIVPVFAIPPAVTVPAAPPVIWNNQSIADVTVPTGTETGPVHAIVGTVPSNPFLFTAGLCNDPSASISCLLNNTCCTGGPFDGQCRTDLSPGISSCDIQQLQSVQSWSFISGVGPGVSCQTPGNGPVPPNACVPSGICGPSQLVCQTSTCTCQPFGIVFEPSCVTTDQSPSPKPNQGDACSNSQLNVQFNASLDLTTYMGAITLEECSNSASSVGNCVGTAGVDINSITIGYSIATTVPAVPNDTVRLMPAALLTQDTVYRATVDTSLQSVGGALFPQSYTWYFKTDNTGIACQPDSCTLTPRTGGGVTSLLAGSNTQDYALASLKACNLILGNFSYDITSDDSNIGAVSIPALPQILTTTLGPPPANGQMTGIGGGSTNIVATNTLNNGLLCRSPFTVTTVIPRVVSYFPSCSTVCTNAVFGVTFSTPVIKADITINNSFRVRQCTGGTCGDNVTGLIMVLNPGSIIWDTPLVNPAGTSFSVSLGGFLPSGEKYRAELDTAQIRSATGEFLLPNIDLAPSPATGQNYFVWEFSTKPDLGGGGTCELDHIVISPEIRTVRAIGVEVPFSGQAFGAPDECSPVIGQQLNPFAYSWENPAAAPLLNGWRSTSPFVAGHTRLGTYSTGLLYDVVPPGGDGIADPTQQFVAVGTDVTCQPPSTTCTAQVIGSAYPNNGNPAIVCDNTTAPSSSLNRCGQIELACGYSTGDQCITGLGLGIGFGVANNTCCAPRPTIDASNPADGDTNICRNQILTIDFNEVIDSNSASNNIFLAKNVGSNPCPAGSTSLLVRGESSTKFVKTPANFVRRIVFEIKEFFRSLFIKDASAQVFYTTGDNLCIVSSSVSVGPPLPAAAPSVDSTVFIAPRADLDYTGVVPDSYVVVVLGDDDPADAINRGLQSNIGVTFSPPVGLPGQVSLQKGGITYNAQLITFDTRPATCELDSVFHQIYTATSIDSRNTHTFFCAGDSCPTDYGPPPNAVSDRPGNQHLLEAYGLDIDGNRLTADMEYIKGGPDFFEICPGTIEDCTASPAPPLPPNPRINGTGGTNNFYSQIRVDDDLPGYSVDASGSLTISASTPSNPSNVVSKTIDMKLFVCNNPWPDVNSFPYADGSLNCNTGTGVCQNTGFEFYYCRDSGGPGTQDDLPALVGGSVIGGSSIGTGISTNQICYGGSQPAVACTVQSDCVCDPNDNSCDQDGVCAASELKNLIFPREGVPAPPFNLLIDLPDPISNSIEVTQAGGDIRIANFNTPPNISIGYKLYWGTTPTSLISSVDLGFGAGLTLPLFVHGLDPGQRYYFAMTSYVRSAFGGAEGSFSDVFPPANQLGLQPIDQKAPLSPPQADISSIAGPGSINISWTPEPSTAFDVTNYEISLRVGNSGIFPQVVDVGSATNYTFTGLTPLTTYQYIIVAKDSSGNTSPATTPLSDTPL